MVLNKLLFSMYILIFYVIQLHIYGFEYLLFMVPSLKNNDPIFYSSKSIEIHLDKFAAKIIGEMFHLYHSLFFEGILSDLKIVFIAHSENSGKSFELAFKLLLI